MSTEISGDWTTPLNASGLTAEIFEPALTALGGGRFAVVWTEDANAGIWVRIIGETGTPEGPAIRVTDSEERGNRPSVELLGDGDFVVTYTNLPDGVRAAIRAQIYSSDGTAIGQKQTLFDDETYSANTPVAASLPGGGFVTVFNTYFGLDGESFGVFAQRSDASGAPVGSRLQVNQTTDSFQSEGVPIALDDGGFAVTWRSREVDGSFYAVMLRTYDADGTPRGNEQRVNQYSSLSQDGADITRLSDGRLVISWDSDGQDGSGDAVYARIYSADGVAQTNEFWVNTSTSMDQKASNISALPDGGFIVVWMHETTTAITDIRLQRFDATGQRVGTETVLEAGDGPLNANPSLDIDADGNAAVAWLSWTQNEFVANIAVANAANIPTAGTAGDDDMRGSDGNDNFCAISGDDILYGRGGNDVLHGGDGNDTVSYADANGGVSVYLQFTGRNVGGGAGRDTLIDIENLTGSGFDDRMVGDTGSNTLTGLSGNDVLKGKGGADTLIGNRGDDRLLAGDDADTLDGGNGSDILIGLAGDDTLNGGNERDFLYGGQGEDMVAAGAGDDELRGNRGNDTLSGGTGSDDLRGGGNNDILFGDTDDDFLFGENGNDILDGGLGDDAITGGAGIDRFVFAEDYGFDRIKDFDDGADRLDLTAFDYSNFMSDVLSRASDTGGGLRIDFGGGDVLFLEGMTVAELDVSDVVL